MGNAGSGPKEVALVQASLVKDHAKVEALLKGGADAAEVDAGGNHGLLGACCSGSEECVELLLADPATPLQLANSMGCSAVWLAAGYGHMPILKRLLSAGGDASASNNTGDSPMIAAASRAHPNCILALLEAGADVLAVNRNGDSCLSIAAGKGLTEAVEAILASEALSSPVAAEGAAAASALVNAQNGSGITAVAAAAAFGDVRSVRALLSAGADAFTKRDKNGATALMVSAHCSNHECVAAILEGLGEGAEAKARLEFADPAGATSLWLAAAAGSKEAVSALLAAGADKLGGSPGGVTAAAAATKNGSAECAALLA